MDAKDAEERVRGTLQPVKKEDCEVGHTVIQLFRDANHSDFCGIIPFFKANFRIKILDVQIPQNNDFKMVPDKIKDVTLTYTPVLRTFYVAVDNYTLTPVVNN